MDRAAAISALIAFDRPLGELRAVLDGLSGESAGAVAVVRRDDIAAVLRRFLAGKIAAGEVEAWACLVECRDDLEFEPRHEEDVADALYDLSDPEGGLDRLAPELLARLG
ncbi:hypothetical protein E2493_06150 [Sphingomonas parva]|uniref:DUF3775 domain-containing protein n=1 Tax=Sphingomonas parva TaxID=2555898 RepID=A0A4Y8ZT60_9SPHN|nr:hypothetical protein [Sphingomonas parva]TFI59104.1 hypothetical protein E2493_06150 [Sphingomonas parva]